MRENTIRNHIEGIVSVIVAYGKVPAIMVLAAFVLAFEGGQACAETLRWKLNPGEVLHYTMESKETLNSQMMGRDKKSSRSTTTNLTWTIKSVSPTGDAQIILRFDRVRMRVEQPPFMPLEFDSNPNKIEIPEEFAAVDRQIKATAGIELTFTLHPTGEVDDLKLPEQTLRKLREGLPKDAAGAEAVSEQGLKDMLMPSKPPVFPAASLDPGQTWAAKPSKIALPIGTLSIDQVFTYQGPDPKTPRLSLVNLEIRVGLQPAENVAVKLRKQEGTGALTFDTEAGRIVNTRNKQKVELVLTERGQDEVRSTEATTTMTLEP